MSGDVEKQRGLLEGGDRLRREFCPMGSVNKETGRCADKKIGLWTGEYWTVLGVCQGGGIKRQASVGDASAEGVLSDGFSE
jgi:hypothetical protein